MGKALIAIGCALMLVAATSNNPQNVRAFVTMAKGSHTAAVEFDPFNPPSVEEWATIKQNIVSSWEHTDKFRSEVLPAVKK